jgi:ArsR family transcriptional regulator, cadmium/lead-responsive transcriptional repressor
MAATTTVNMEALARVGRALSDESRRRLLVAILEGCHYPAEMAGLLQLSKANVSNHLACLRGCGLVTALPEGRRVRYELSDDRLAHALADISALPLLGEDHGHDHGEADSRRG